MKDLIISNTIDNIKKHYNYSETKLLEIKYGLEVLYLNIFKTIVILLINLIIKSFNELLLFTLFYGLLRLTGFGLHTNKSWQCWISSLLIFIGIPNLIKYFEIPYLIIIIMDIIFIILLGIYAPADTKKRPLIRKKKRIVYKVSTIIIGIIYFLYTIFANNVYFNNILCYSLCLETLLVLPIVYKFFNLEYKNYRNYKEGGKL